MIRSFTAACLVATALTAVPALAQGNAHPSSSTATQQSAKVTAAQFVHQAAQSAMFEIQSSRIALDKSQDKDIRQFAQRMIDDHTKADDELKTLARSEVPSSLDHEHEAMIDKLKSMNGSAFAEQYKQMQVQGHQQAVALFQDYAKDGENKQLKQFAEQTLPTLQDHLRMAQGIDIAGNNANPAATSTAAAGSNDATSANTTTQASNGAAAGGAGYLSSEPAGVWRASKMIGLSVYNQQNQQIGRIDEILFNKDGQVQAVVIGVGGFLGMGQHDVAVPYTSLTWDMQRVSSPALANRTLDPTLAPSTGPVALGNPVGAPTGASPTPGAAPNQVDQSSGNQPANPAYPDHAVLANASKDDLQKAPQFHFGDAPQ